MLKFHVRLTPTKEEIIDGLQRASLRKAGTVRLILQATALSIVSVWSLIAFFGGGMQEWMSLLIGVTALVLIPVMWLVPRWKMNSLAQSIVESGAAPQMWVFEDGIDFGEQPPEYAYYPYGSFYVAMPKMTGLQTIVMKFPNDDVIVVPKGCFTTEEWDFLCEKLTATKETKPAKKDW